MGQEIWYRGEAVGVAQAPGKTNPHDFVDGMYLTDSPTVAARYAETRTTDPNARRVWSVPIQRDSMRVLDLTTDPRWQKFMQPIDPRLPSNEQLIKQANENYGRLFKQFAAKENIDLNQYDAIVGPEYVRGGQQMCIVNKGGKPSPLQGQLRGLFRPVPAQSGALPSTVPRGKITDGRIGMGLKAAGGIMAMLALQFLVEFIWAKVLGKMLDDEMKKLEPTIQAGLKSRIRDVAELLSQGKKAFAVVTVTITDGSFGLPEGGSAPLPPKAEFNEMRISDHEEKGEGQVQTERSYRVEVNHHPVTYSFEVNMLPEEVELYRAYKLELQWYDAQVQDPHLVEQDLVRLTRDREALMTRLNRAINP
jgi:hypothetical protein